MEAKLAQDLKEAMLSGDKTKTEVLKGIKNAIQYEVVAQGSQSEGLSEEQIQKVLAREAKKRAEAADLYEKAGETDRAATERQEKAIIDSYLPEQIDEGAIAKAVKEQVALLDSPDLKSMGAVIAAVRQQLGAGADGGTIARLTKQELEK